MSVMGLDLGGSGAKAAAFDLSGRLLAAAKTPYAFVPTGDGCAELEPDCLWESLKSSIIEVANSEDVAKDPVKAIGISVAGEAMVPVGRNGDALYNTIATPDPRGREYVPKLDQSIGAARIYEMTGQPLDNYWTLIRALWLRDHVPDVFNRTWKFALWQEYVLLRLGLDPVLEWSNAARTLAFDIRAHDWWGRILDDVGIDSSSFARLVPPGTPVGWLGPGGPELDLSPETLIVAGGFDQCCASLGAGLTDSSVASIGTGSVEAVAIATTQPPMNEGLRAANFSTSPHLCDGQFLTIGSSFTAGSLLRWYTEVLAADELGQAKQRHLDVYELVFRGVSSEPSALLVLPHLAGGFSPHRDPGSKGAILGLTLDTPRGELLRGLLEGMAFELRMILESAELHGLQVHELRNSGGGAKSPEWMQIKADVLGRPIATVSVTDSAPLGAAVLAAVAVDEYPNCSSAVEAMVHVEHVYHPEPLAADLYKERFELYRDLYPAIARFHHSLRHERSQEYIPGAVPA